MLHIDKVTYEELPTPECECVQRFMVEEMVPMFGPEIYPQGSAYLHFTRGDALGLLDENPEPGAEELPWEHQEHIKAWIDSLPYIKELDNHIDLFVSW